MNAARRRLTSSLSAWELVRRGLDADSSMVLELCEDKCELSSLHCTVEDCKKN